MKKWWAPKPYETPEVEMELKPGGKFRTRMTGPDGFDTGGGGEGCFLDIVDGERIVWTSARADGYRPNDPTSPDCGGLIFTAKTHADMGFHDGWGTCADQLGEIAASLKD